MWRLGVISGIIVMLMVGVGSECVMRALHGACARCVLRALRGVALCDCMSMHKSRWYNNYNEE